MSFSNIKTDELKIWMKVLVNEDSTTESVLKELKLIDDLLRLQASKSLLLRKVGLRAQLEARIMQDLGYSVRLDVRTRKYVAKN